MSINWYVIKRLKLLQRLGRFFLVKSKVVHFSKKLSTIYKFQVFWIVKNNELGYYVVMYRETKNKHNHRLFIQNYI